MTYTSHTIQLNLFKVFNSLVFSTFTELNNHHHNQSYNIFISPKTNSILINTHSCPQLSIVLPCDLYFCEVQSDVSSFTLDFSNLSPLYLLVSLVKYLSTGWTNFGFTDFLYCFPLLLLSDTNIYSFFSFFFTYQVAYYISWTLVYSEGYTFGRSKMILNRSKI